MRRLFGALMSIIGVGLCACVAAGAPDARGPEDDTIDRGFAAAYFREAEALSVADAGALWGVVMYGPMMFVDSSTMRAVANQADAEGKLERRDGVFVGTLPQDLMVANTSLVWSGTRWTVILWPLPESKYARARLMMHESFHRVQDDLRLPAASPSNAHLYSKDARIWLQMEYRALGEALIREGEASATAIADAASFRNVRRTLFAAGADEERALELNEGLAEYTGWRLCGLPTGAAASRAASRLEEPSQGGLSRNFAYRTGPAYGMLLDRIDPTWRSSLTPESDLAGLLFARRSIKPAAQALADAMGRIDRYGGSLLIAAEARREESRQRRLAEYQRALIDGPVLGIALGPEVQYSYDPNGIEILNDHDSVYGTLKLSDEWGTLEVGSMALLTRDHGRIVRVRVPAPTDPNKPTQGEGWSLSLRGSWRLVRNGRPGDWTITNEK